MNRDIVVSIKTVIFTLALFLGVYVVYRLGPILALILISIILVMALEPAVDFFMKMTIMNRPVPRGIAVTVTFLLFLAAVVFIFTSVAPPVIVQARNLIKSLSTGFAQFPFSQKLISFSDLLPNITDVSGNVINITLSFFSNIFTVLSVLVITLYMSMDWMNIKSRFVSFFPASAKSDAEDILYEVEVNIGHWVKGQLLLMFVIGIFSFLGFVILDVDYPLALALFAGLLEIVPVLGPIVAGVLAAVVGFTVSPIKGLAVIGFSILLQQLENNFLVPKIMQKVSGFSPLVIMIALLVGSNFFGVIGALVAVPVTMILAIILKYVLQRSF
ncbi:MAG: hypothetical protein UX44_C0005G0022 [candidate division WWE3 bacterium GW2011_GWA1_46_21]|uniref:Permease n=3 Tax=Katanobacteria TaxID=422282 RepID=A0A0G1PFH8_UNCKA|nr:MAG: hypothetical protein UX44_C0005G0022 [candidate division WWE3 bacterium GW2011_GWA1_46_21]KKU51495.1 MAG: hypothetical protein UX73_C0001G0027 [candidate division WWE3 bacterium GW2011_GWC1_47_10]KKU57866.1 MAG: hypothetical protein UX79_C0004G0022 [candidate division WWE3 bacterium GW2011_GWB1_47_11]